MKEFLAPDIWPMLMIAIVWWLLCLVPVLLSSIVAVRAKPALPRRLLFVSVVAGLSYGLLLFFFVGVLVPLGAFSTFIAPQLEAIGELPVVGRWFVSASRAIDSWYWFVVPFVLSASSIWLTRFLAARWHQLTLALGPNNSFKPKPLRGSA